MKSIVLVILAVSLLGIGIGQTAISVLGIPYIDDNVQSKQSPMYMAITIGVRVLGPAIGYYLGSLCISKYVDLTTQADPMDPNFIGAWWLGKSRSHELKYLSGMQPIDSHARERKETTEVNQKPGQTSLELNSRLKNKKIVFVVFFFDVS